ncbi:MAG: T9SS type A sorting domain-containing protein [Bacteroidetes bacterium]|nr:T9SS type A sorting domain-containing protein [Bacteroidota bacterium]MBS1629337.1 T9SS type A sorting domain-containing protein [Bacteroidota bacterium]
MRKVLTIIAITLACHYQASADGWTVVRSWCGGFFHQKYQAFAQISLLTYTTYPTGYNQVGQYVGTNPKGAWSNICSSEDKACSRVRTATCSRSGTGHDVIINGGWFQGGLFNYNSYIQTVLDFSGQHVTQSNFNGRTKTGAEGTYEMDADKLANFSERGFSFGDVSGPVDIVNDQQLVINNLKGTVSIANSSNYFSKFKILVVKENENETDEQAQASDSLRHLGIFLNVVDSSELSVSKNIVTATGVFAGLTESELSQIQNADSAGFNLNNISLTKDLNVQLAEGEHLTVITYIDGGLDISSAVLNQGNPSARMAPASTTVTAQTAHFYPNPVSSGVLNCDVESKVDDANVSITAFDILGRQLGELYSGKVTRGVTSIKDINVSNLPKGIQILKVKVGDYITSHQITVN